MTDFLQHADRNISPAEYRHLAADELLITKIFYTIQGEGPFAGYPAVFVRLAGCNRGRKEGMGCRFCDTKFHFDAGKPMPFDEILGRVIELTPNYSETSSEAPLIVITGGEPMIQDNIVQFLTAAHKGGFHRLQVESNGDRLAKGYQYGLSTLVVSPKVKPLGYGAPHVEVILGANFLKFVVSANPESLYNRLPIWVAELDPSKVFVSPLTVYSRAVAEGEVASAWNLDLLNIQATKQNYAHAAKLALTCGYRLSMQQHLFFGVE